MTMVLMSDDDDDDDDRKNLIYNPEHQTTSLR